MLKTKKFKDISSIYKFTEVTDEYILSKKGNLNYKIVIYSVEPVVMLDYSKDTKNEILTNYTEVLKELDIGFQILVINKKIDIARYIENTKELNIKSISKNKMNAFYEEYMNDLEELLNKANIYETKYYLVFSIDITKEKELENIENSILRLNKIGCYISRLKGVDNIKRMLYECINKENI